MSKLTQNLQDAEFKTKVTDAKGLVLVDFWAEWCGPCKTLGPTIDKLADAYRDSLQVYKVNVDSNPKAAASFKIRGIPTVILFKDGVAVDQIVGNQPSEIFEHAIQKHI